MHWLVGHYPKTKFLIFWVCDHVRPLQASVGMKQLPSYVLRWRNVGRLSMYVWVLADIGVRQEG